MVVVTVINVAHSAALAQADLNGARLQQLLQRYPDADTDKDGKLTAGEARAYLRKIRPAKKVASTADAPATPESLKNSDSANTATAPKAPSQDSPARTKTYDKDVGPRPDLEDVSYGSHERLKLDLWKARSDQSTPILVFFHGGGGDKLMYRGNRLLMFCLKNGISAAAVNYRPNNQFPFPVPMHDAGRAIQFLRHKATEFNLDPKRVAATGTSLGANVSTWLAYHDDIADPTSDDPVLRESSRLCFVIAGAGQTFNDMELFRERVYPYDAPAGAAVGLSREKAREISAIYHVTPDDPPIFMTYGIPLEPLPLPKETPRGELIHNPAFGLLLKEKLDELGIENHFFHGGNKPPGDAQEKFILKHFFGQTSM
jgi:acetyl esterase/lipase